MALARAVPGKWRQEPRHPLGDARTARHVRKMTPLLTLGSCVGNGTFSALDSTHSCPLSIAGVSPPHGGDMEGIMSMRRTVAHGRRWLILLPVPCIPLKWSKTADVVGPGVAVGVEEHVESAYQLPWDVRPTSRVDVAERRCDLVAKTVQVPAVRNGTEPPGDVLHDHMIAALGRSAPGRGRQRSVGG